MSSLWNTLKETFNKANSTINNAVSQAKNWKRPNTQEVLSNLEKSKVAQYQFKKSTAATPGSKDNPYGLVNADSLNRKEQYSDFFIGLGSANLIFKCSFSNQIEYCLKEAGLALENSLTQVTAGYISKTATEVFCYQPDIEINISYISVPYESSSLIFSIVNNKWAASTLPKEYQKNIELRTQLSTIINRYATSLINIDENGGSFTIKTILSQPEYVEKAIATKDTSEEQAAIQKQAEAEIKAAAEYLETQGEKEKANILKTVDVTQLPLTGGSLAELIEDSGIHKVPTENDKKETVSAVTESNRKPVSKIEVKAMPMASVIQSSLSKENLEAGENIQDPRFDKRPGNAKNGDIYGLESKINSPGCIKLYKSDGSSGYAEPLTVDCFLLQSVQSSLKEKFSVFQSLSGDILAYFFGKHPIVYRYSAALYNTYNQEWFHDFKYYYDNYLRGSASISKNIRTVVSYENHIIEGFFLEMNMQESTTNTNIVNIDFSILFIQEHILYYSEPDISYFSESPKGGLYDLMNASDVIRGQTSGTIGTGTDPRLDNVIEGYSVAKPDGLTSVITNKKVTIKSSPADLTDNNLKTIGEGKVITVYDDPIQGSDGNTWYAIQSGTYDDGRRMSAKGTYIKVDDVSREKEDTSLSSKKEFNKENPSATIVKTKSDFKASSLTYANNENIVKSAGTKSQNHNSNRYSQIKKSGVSLLSGPSKNAEILATLNKGDYCEVLKQEGIYSVVVYNDLKGYVERTYIK